MKPVERPVLFACGADQLVGIVTQPQQSTATSGVGIVIVVGGPQYRVGAHRQFVQLARALAAAGHAVLRFDVRGMGDSTGEPRGFEALDDDIGAAVGALQREVPSLQRLALWGLCDGASAALTYIARRQDTRIGALCLVNPWLRSAQSMAKTHVKHYYRQRLVQRAFWVKLLGGGVAIRAARDLWANLRLSTGSRQVPPDHPTADFRTLMARGWHAFMGPMLLVTSNDDYTAREFIDGCSADPAWLGALLKAQLHRVELTGADHTFSNTSARLAMEAAVTAWLQPLAATQAGIESGEVT